MPENKHSRNFQSQSTLHTGLRLEGMKPTVENNSRTIPYKHLSHQQRTALVAKLIDFLKSM